MIEYDMGDFMLSCAEAYKKAAGEPNMTLRPVDTPFLEIHEEEEPTGKLQPIASSVLMKLLLRGAHSSLGLAQGHSSVVYPCH